MSQIHDFLGVMCCHTQLSASSSDVLLPLILQKIKEDNISQSADYDVPFCEQQDMHGYIFVQIQII